MLSLNQLKLCLPKLKEIDLWYEALNTILPDYDVNTANRIAAFLAQCAHESAEFTAVKENLNYGAEGLLTTFKKYFNAQSAAVYARKPEQIANLVYANRMGNGDEKSGDGYRYRGRGLIQLTGKNNYQKFAEHCKITLDECVDYMQTKEGAVQSACWYWKTNNLNVLADLEDIVTMTKKINGGTIGLEDRKLHYKKFKAILC